MKIQANGRAAVIVPEGIIFQSQNAYKQLRKMLVGNYLYAVVSLPAGVFQPYSGVKTSILLMDKTLAKKCDSILFVKIENDGFDLGAQRREIQKNDLPEALRVLRDFHHEGNGNGVGAIPCGCPTLVVKKDKIAENGEWNLSGERYRENDELGNSDYELVELGELCELVRGVTYTKKDEVSENGHLVLRANNINNECSKLNLDDIKQISSKLSFSEEKKLRGGDIFICLASGSKSHIGKVALIEKETNYFFGGFMGAVRCNFGIINSSYLFHQLNSNSFNDFLREQISGANINNLGAKLLYQYKIPLPPLKIQQEIVAEIEGYQKIIDGARAVVENYKPQIQIDPEWEMVKLGDVCDVFGGGTPSSLDFHINNSPNNLS